MEIKRKVWSDGDYSYYYIDNKYGYKFAHGLLNWYNSICFKHIGYNYRENKKGFWLRNF